MIEANRERVIVNPLRERNEPGKNSRGKRTRRLSMMNKSLGTECTLTTVILILSVIVGGYAISVSTMRPILLKAPLCFGAMNLLFVVAANNAVVRFQESKMRRKTHKTFLLALFGYMVLLVVLIVAPKGHGQSATVDGPQMKSTYDTGNCSIVKKNTMLMSCMRNIKTAPFARSIHPIWRSEFEVKRLDELVHRFLSLVNQLSGGDADTDCTEFAENVICNTVFRPCSSTCEPVKFCKYHLCGVKTSLCGNSKQLKHFTGLDQLFDKSSSTYKTAVRLVASATIPTKEVESVLDGVYSIIQTELKAALEMSDCSRYNDSESGCLLPAESALDENVLVATEVEGNCDKQSMLRAAEPTEATAHEAVPTEGGREDIILAAACTICGLTFAFLFFQSYLASKASRTTQTPPRGTTSVGRGARAQSMRKSLTERHLSLMTPVEKGKIGIGGAVLAIIGGLMFWHAYRQEKLIDTAPNEIQGLAYLMLAVFYMFAVRSLYSAVAILSSMLRGVVFLKLERKVNIGKKTVVSQALELWRSNFGFPNGKYLFQKLLCQEIFEVITQYMSMDSIARGDMVQGTPPANLNFVIMSYILLSLNATFSPLILCFRKKCKAQAKLIVYFFDAVLDGLFVFNNLWRGGAMVTKLDVDPWINLAILYPLLCIYLRMQEVYKFVVKRTRKRAEGSTLETSSQGKRVLKTRSMQQLLRSSASSMRHLVAQNEKKIEKSVELTVVFFGVTLVISLSIMLSASYWSCSAELGPSLWAGASPKLMFKQGVWSPNCGYEEILTINAESRGIVRIPDAIEKCTKLQVLQLKNNNIKDLPCSLLRMGHVRFADLSDNEVDRKLLVSCDVKEQVFPTEFICQNMRSLQIVDASHQPSITSVGPCIERLRKLSQLILKGNGIEPGGVATSIVKLPHLSRFEVSGNPVYHHLQWRNTKIGRAHQKTVFDFIIRHFSNHLKILELDGNDFDDNLMVFHLTRFLPSLQTLNVSNNKIGMLAMHDTLLVSTTVGDCNSAANIEWKNLEVLDISHNPIVGIDSNILRFFVRRSNSSRLLLRGTSVQTMAMRGCGLRRIPRVLLDAMPRLVSLDIGFNRDLYIDNDEMLYLCKFKHLRALRIKGCAGDSNVTKIPDCYKNFFILNFRKKKEGFAASLKYKWPSFFSTSTFLQSLDMDVSDLNMNVAELNSFSNTSRLTILKFGGTVTKPGPLPVYFDKTITLIEHLDLWSCKLYGEIPAYNFSKLRLLELHNNELSGPIPREILMNPELSIAKFNYNNLNGTVPEIPLSRLKGMECLMMHGNGKLRGLLPDVYLNEAGIITYISLPIMEQNGTSYGFNLTRLQERAVHPRDCSIRADAAGKSYIACFTIGFEKSACNI